VYFLVAREVKEVYRFSYLTNSGLLNVSFKCQNQVSVKFRGVEIHMMLS